MNFLHFAHQCRKRSGLSNLIWSNRLTGCVFFVLTTVWHTPTWLAMGWCWLQTGWQGLQGGQGHIVSEATADLPTKDSSTDRQWQHISTQLTSPPPLPLLPDRPYLSYSSRPFAEHPFVFIPLSLYFLLSSPLISWNSCVRVLVIVNWPLARPSMSWMSRLNPRGPGNRQGHNAAAPGPCTADPETCLMVFENHWRQVSPVVQPLNFIYHPIYLWAIVLHFALYCCFGWFLRQCCNFSKR